MERAKTLLAYYKGEISLEEIKSATAKYQAEMEQRWQEEQLKEKRQQVQAVPKPVVQQEIPEQIEEPTPEKAPEQEETPVYETVSEYEEASVSEEVQEYEEVPEYEEAAVSAEEAELEAAIEQQIEQILENDEETLGNAREEEELYVLEAETIETGNDRLAELLRKKKVSIPEILKNFGRMERIQKQVVKSLELAISDREKAYFVITGEPQTGKTTLALSMIRLLFELDIVKYDRTATIDAVQLNQVSLEDYGEELKNCNLIIENAGGMTKESVDGLLRFSKGNKGKTCVILEDSIRNINKFLRAREELNSLFNNRIHLGKYTAEELMGFVYDYIKKEDYGIDKMAAQVLRDKIDEIVREYGNEQRLVQTLKLAETQWPGQKNVPESYCFLWRPKDDSNGAITWLLFLTM